MGEQVKTLKPAMLYAEVRAFEWQKGAAPEQSDPEKVAFALHRVQKGRVGKRRDGGRDAAQWDGYDVKKYCVFCRYKGHDVKECYKSLWKKQIVGEEERDGCSRRALNEWGLNGQGQRQGPAKFITWEATEMRRFFSGCNSRRPGKKGSTVGFFVLHLQRFSIFIFYCFQRRE
jgi:hypothetical protein